MFRGPTIIVDSGKICGPMVVLCKMLEVGCEKIKGKNHSFREVCAIVLSTIRFVFKGGNFQELNSGREVPKTIF
jgi:hypothetical protein